MKTTTRQPVRILIVEDEPDIASVLADYLRHDGFAADIVGDGAQAMREIATSPPDLVLLDVMLPGASGLDVLRSVRSAAAPRDTLPVIMITARVEEVDRLLGLELGADDYICKPFSPREVVARVKTVLRRTRPPVPPVGLLLDAGHWRASIDGVALALTRKEFDLLQTLAQHPGRIYSRAALLDLVYAHDLDANERAIDSHIKNLRRKIAAVADGHDWIRSVYGVGFVLEPPPT